MIIISVIFVTLDKAATEHIIQLFSQVVRNSTTSLHMSGVSLSYLTAGVGNSVQKHFLNYICIQSLNIQTAIKIQNDLGKKRWSVAATRL